MCGHNIIYHIFVYVILTSPPLDYRPAPADNGKSCILNGEALARHGMCDVRRNDVTRILWHNSSGSDRNHHFFGFSFYITSVLINNV